MEEEVLRRVTVNRNLTPWEAIAATGCDPYIDLSITERLPRGTSEEVELVFFQLERHYTTDDELEKEFVRRGLKPADPFALAAANAADFRLANMPHGTHWKDAHGRWCDITFDSCSGNRRVRVHTGGDWERYWWFAGVRT